MLLQCWLAILSQSEGDKEKRLESLSRCKISVTAPAAPGRKRVDHDLSREWPCSGAVAAALLMTGSQQACSHHSSGLGSETQMTKGIASWSAQFWGEWEEGCRLRAGSECIPICSQHWESRARGCTRLAPITCPMSSPKETLRRRPLGRKALHVWANPCSLYMPRKHQHCLCTIFPQPVWGRGQDLLGWGFIYVASFGNNI